MTLPNWTRRFYQSAGGDPFLFYVVYGGVDLAAPLSRGTYRSEGVPDGIELMHYTAERHASVLSGFRKGYLWERLTRDAPEFAGRIASATACVIVRGTPRDATTLNYLRDVVGLLTHLLDHGGLGIYDPQMFVWWQRELWHQRIFAPGAPVPAHHVMILTSPPEAGRGTWFHTRGMLKFGRPDLSLHDAPLSMHAAVIELFNRFIELQAFGGVIPEGQAIHMASLPEGMTCHHGGGLDDPAFNNFHVEIRWPTKV